MDCDGVRFSSLGPLSTQPLFRKSHGFRLILSVGPNPESESRKSADVDVVRADVFCNLVGLFSHPWRSLQKSIFLPMHSTSFRL